jgi:hypothetical protein
MLGDLATLGGWSHITENQPFYLHALGETLRRMEDSDWEIYATGDYSFARGVSVGPGHVFSRTYYVFPEKSKFRRYDDGDLVADMDNYKSASSEVLERQFLEEAEMGLMERVPTETARREYGQTLRIAAQGAILKGDSGWRVIHDGTHGVRGNHDISLVDQIQFSTAEDLKKTMAITKSSGAAVCCGLKADVRKAHRRVVHPRSDWGYLACRTASSEDHVWLNRCGTFG